MAYALRSKDKLQTAPTEHIYATLAKRDRLLLCANITGQDREEDYALCFKHRVIGIDKDYVSEYRADDLINIYMAYDRDHSMLLVSRITDISTTEPDDYLNEGGRMCRYYVRFQPIAELKGIVCGFEYYKPKFYKEDGTEFQSEFANYNISCFQYYLNKASVMANLPRTHSLTYTYNSWVNENYVETRKTGYDLTTCMLFYMITAIGLMSWNDNKHKIRHYNNVDYIQYRTELFKTLGEKNQVNKWAMAMDRH